MDRRVFSDEVKLVETCIDDLQLEIECAFRDARRYIRDLDRKTLGSELICLDGLPDGDKRIQLVRVCINTTSKVRVKLRNLENRVRELYSEKEKGDILGERKDSARADFQTPETPDSARAGSDREFDLQETSQS